MTSNQMSKPTGKAAKFVAANPLAPMADPFAGLDDDQKEFQSALSENINNRLIKAVDELKEKHSKGTNEIDDEDRAPTGYAYRAHQAEAAKRQRALQRQKDIQRQNDAHQMQQMKAEAKDLLSRQRNKNESNSDNEKSEDDSDDDDDKYLDGLEDNPELESIRLKRLEQMKNAQIQHAENKAKGHGQYRTIYQDDFLTECTSSTYVACHFFHKEFMRCKIMDHHLEIIAPCHTTCKFVRIDAEKAPFFVSKLQIKSLPTLLVFKDGKVIDKKIGFEGLSGSGANDDPDKWHTSKLQQWIASTGAITYKMPDEEMLEEMKRLGLKPKGSVWSSEMHNVDKDDFCD